VWSVCRLRTARYLLLTTSRVSVLRLLVHTLHGLWYCVLYRRAQVRTVQYCAANRVQASHLTSHPIACMLCSSHPTENRLSRRIYNRLRSFQWRFEARDPARTIRQPMVSVATVNGVTQADFRTHQHFLQLVVKIASTENRFAWPILDRLRSFEPHSEANSSVRTVRQCMVSFASKLGVVIANFGTHQHFLQLVVSNCFYRKSSFLANMRPFEVIKAELRRNNYHPNGSTTYGKRFY
jgi:hypothetical protein